MEFWQFHPTGVSGAGVLITEGVRGEGGILINSQGELHGTLCPTFEDLAPRDFVSFYGPKRSKKVRLRSKQRSRLVGLRHIGADTIQKRLPSILEIGPGFTNVDATKTYPQLYQRFTTKWAVFNQYPWSSRHNQGWREYSDKWFVCDR